MARGAQAVSERLFQGARPTGENAFKIQLVQRTLAAMLADVKKG